MKKFEDRKDTEKKRNDCSVEEVRGQNSISKANFMKSYFGPREENQGTYYDAQVNREWQADR